MDEGAKQANQEIRENVRERELLKRLDRIIVLLEILTNTESTTKPFSTLQTMLNQQFGKQPNLTTLLEK